MSVTSCQQKIELVRSYYNIFPIEIIPASATNISEAIIYTFFVQSKHFGLSEDMILDAMASTFPQYTKSDIQSQLLYFIQRGLLITLQPVCRNWCIAECPTKMFAIGSSMDKLVGFEDLVLYLIQLAGGTRVTTSTFSRWFKNNSNNGNLPTIISSTKRAVMSSVCV